MKKIQMKPLLFAALIGSAKGLLWLAARVNGPDPRLASGPAVSSTAPARPQIHISDIVKRFPKVTVDEIIEVLNYRFKLHRMDRISFSCPGFSLTLQLINPDLEKIVRRSGRDDSPFHKENHLPWFAPSIKPKSAAL